MTALVWDAPGERLYETGVDRAVIYFEDDSAMAWNGIISVSESSDNQELRSYYLDGVKYLDSTTLGVFEANIKAYTYPEQVAALEGLADIDGMYIADNQPKETFGLCYRTRVGNDQDGLDHGYKLHLLYNLTAMPDGRDYNSLSDDPEAIEFGWNVTGVPVYVPGARPTNHLILDSRNYPPALMQDLEERLYGTSTTAPELLSPLQLYWFIGVWVPPTSVVTITDNGNGTWTATGSDANVTMIDATTYTITDATIVTIDANTYTISDG